MRWRGGTRKFVLREAMRDWLPADVRLRLTSPDAGSAFVPTLRALADDGLFRGSDIEREGWVDAGALRAFYDQILSRQADGDDYTNDVWPMWIVAAVELWMREVSDRHTSESREGRCDEMMTPLTSGS
jgi:hypothetical protein